MQHCMPCPDIELNVEESCADMGTMDQIYAKIQGKRKTETIINIYSNWKEKSVKTPSQVREKGVKPTSQVREKSVKTPSQVRLTSIVDWMRNEFSGLQSVRLPGQNQIKKDKPLEFWDAIFLFTDKIHSTSTSAISDKMKRLIEKENQQARNEFWQKIEKLMESFDEQDQSDVCDEIMIALYIILKERQIQFDPDAQYHGYTATDISKPNLKAKKLHFEIKLTKSG